jgi:MFS family permease
VNEAGASSALFNKPFVMLCLAMFLAYASQWLMTPIIPLYVDHMGGSAFVAGLALLAFAVPSFTARPFLGHLADRWTAVGVLACGLMLLAVGSLLHLVPLLSMLFVGAIVRGIGWGGANIGGYTTLASAAPPQRRGEAAGYYTSIVTSVSIVFPAVALWLVAGSDGFQIVFALSAAMALLGLPMAWALARSLGDKKKTAEEPGTSGSMIDKGVLLATGLNLCSTLASPSVMAFLPLYARSLGIDNIGLFYVLAGITSIVVRPLLGKKSDAIGRGPAIALGLSAQLTGLVLILLAQGLGQILVGGFFVALGWSMIGATTTALAMDLTDPKSRGRGMATFSLSFQLGVGLGSLIAGALADLTGLRGMYAGSIAMTLAGFGLLALAWKRMPQPARSVVTRS